MMYPKQTVYINRQLDKVLEDTKNALHKYWDTTGNINLFEKDGLPLAISGSGKHFTCLLTVERLRIELSKVAIWYTLKADKKVDVIPPDFVCHSILAMPLGILKPLKSVCYGPIFTGNGWIQEIGYNANDQVYRTLDTINTSYTAQHETFTTDIDEARKLAAEARAFIWDELLDGFIFETNADKTNMIASIFLPFVLRYIDDATPITLIEAAKNNSGKSTLAQFPGIISTGQPIPTITPEPDTSQAQFSTLVTSHLMQAPPLVVIDNVDFELRSSKLCSIVTEVSFSDRLLTTNRMIDIEAKTQWIITANNTRMSDQFARRIIRSKIAKAVDGRTFKRKELKQWLIQNRTKCIQAITSIINLWDLEGRADGDATMSSFEKYARVMAGLMNAGGFPDFLKNYREIQLSYDRIETDLKTLVHSWFSKYGGADCKMSDLQMIAEKDQLFIEELTGANPAARLAQFSKVLNQHIKREIDGFIIDFEINKKNKQKCFKLIDTVKNRTKRPASTIIALVKDPDTLTSQLANPDQIPAQDSVNPDGE